MSWETLTIGHIKFKENVNKEERRKIIKELEKVVECKIKYDDKWDEYNFTDINWTSHVEGKAIWQIFKKWKHKLKFFDTSIYYLSEPHEIIYFNRENKQIRLNIL